MTELLWDRIRMLVGSLTRDNVRAFEGKFEEDYMPAYFLIERYPAPTGTGLVASRLISFYLRPGKPPALGPAS